MKDMNKKQFTIFIGVIIAIALLFFVWNVLKNNKQDEMIINDPQNEQVLVNQEPQNNPSNQVQVPTCNTGYEKTVESRVISEESPALITKVEKKCDGNYYVTVDYLGPSSGDPESGNGSYYTNTNLKLRTFRVDGSARVVALTNDYNEVKTFKEYYPTLSSVNYEIFGVKNVLMRNGASSSVYNLKIQNGQIISFDEVYLP